MSNNPQERPLRATERVGADGITRMQFVEFLGASGTVSSGVSAFRAALRYLPMGKVIACLFSLPGMAWIAERIGSILSFRDGVGAWLTCILW